MVPLSPNPSLPHTLARSLTNTQANAFSRSVLPPLCLSLSLSLAVFLALSLALARSLSLALSHAYKHTHSLSLSLSLSWVRTEWVPRRGPRFRQFDLWYHSLPTHLPRKHTLALSRKLTHIYLALFVAFSISRSRSRSLVLSLSLFRTHTHARTHTHSHGARPVHQSNCFSRRVHAAEPDEKEVLPTCWKHWRRRALGIGLL